MPSKAMFRVGDNNYIMRYADGTLVKSGDEINLGDETLKVMSMTRGPEYNGTAKVLCEITRSDTMETRVGWQNDFYHQVLSATVERVTLDIGSTTYLETEGFKAKSRIIGWQPVTEQWIVEITTPKHPTLRRGTLVPVELGSDTLTAR